MSLHKSKLKSLEDLIMEVKADVGTGQRSLFDNITELKEELTTQKKRVVELRDSVYIISGSYEKNNDMKMKADLEKGLKIVL